ncbi:Beta-glucosidase [Arthrobotrys entomopaga]|nr:Beta-glucosidase [Arthrobotrys entomopaga]
MASFYKVGLDKERVDVNLDSWTTDVYGFQHWFARENYRVVNGNVDVRGTHAALIREIASKGTVLLKNNGSLPLGRPRQIAVFGSDAIDNPKGPNGCPDRGCSDGTPEGTVAMGWGSGTANFPYLISPLNALQNKAIADGSVIQWVVDDYAYNEMNYTARQADTCLVFVKSLSGEGYITVDGNQGDRKNLTLWRNGEEVIKTVAGNCKNTIVTVHAPGPVTMEEWIDHPNVTAVLFAGLPGQESGNSIVDVLYGLVEPGRLPFTIAKNASDYGVSLMYEPDNNFAPQQNFTDALYIDYRYFDKHNINPRFPFGHGLSYTSWKYDELKVRKINAGPYYPINARTPVAKETNVTETPSSLLFPSDFHQVNFYVYPWLDNTHQYGLDGNGTKGPSGAYDPTGTPVRPAGGAPGGHPGLYDILYEVNVTVSNVGKRNGEEVVQLYISQGESDDPVRVLRGFRRISVDAGGSTNVIFTILRRDISRWDVTTQNWVISKAPKTVYVGRSSRDLPLSAKLE